MASALPLKVLHVIPSLDPSQGGPSTAMPQIAKALSDQGVSVDVACVDPVPQANHEGAWVETDKGYRILRFSPLNQRFRLSYAYVRWLARNVSQYDLIHVHGVLNAPCLAAERAAVSQKVPLVVRPLGILNRWGMQNRKALLKKIWFGALEKPLLDQAAAMHYTSREELDDVSRLGIRAPARVLPLGMDMTPFQNLPDRASFRREHDLRETTKLVLFLSRIHPKKGLEVLLEAFALLRRQQPDVRLMIAGDGEADYLSKLRALASELGLEEAILWTGFLNASERLRALAAADLFCLPSSSENFGIALLEAMAAGLPCVSSPEVALAQEPATQGAVRVVPRDPSAWAEAMDSLLSDEAQARELGQRAVHVCQEHYSTRQLGANLLQLYSELVITPARVAPNERRTLGPVPAPSPPPAQETFLSQITPVILTWNEESNLERCLDRLQWAKRVVVLDSGSTDATAAIASRYANVSLVHRAFDNHTAQWNHGVAQATSDWILSLDADYALDEGFAKELADLRPEPGVDAFEARFRYCVYGKPLRGSLYPPRAVLFRRDRCQYVQDGHTQVLEVKGSLQRLHSMILHDDRKPLSRWFFSQDNYAKLEADKLLATHRDDLKLPDRLRLTSWAAVPATFLYVLVAKRALLDGWQGWFYALQRTLAETMLALRLIEKRLPFRNSPP